MSLIIPKELKVGFQTRKDCFTNKLSYIIFKDKTKWRKEPSWEGWRDKKIEPVFLENTPVSGFCLNKGQVRFNDWGSGRTVVRVYDPRDFEFEISLDNLLGILTYSSINRREVDGEYVYAWEGKNLVLLPVGSPEYKEAVENTVKQAKRVSKKDMKPGCWYRLKDGTDGLYLGDYHYYGYSTLSTQKKCIFYKTEADWRYNHIFPHSQDHVCEIVSDIEETGWGKHLNKFLDSKNYQEFDKMEYTIFENRDRYRYGNQGYIKIEDNFYIVNYGYGYYKSGDKDYNTQRYRTRYKYDPRTLREFKLSDDERKRLDALIPEKPEFYKFKIVTKKGLKI